MNTRLFDMLHDRTDHNLLAVGDCVDIHFNGAIKEVIQQYRAVVGDFHRITQVALELVFLINNLHRPTTQHVGRTNDQRITNLVGRTNRFFFTAYGRIRRLQQIEALNHLLEALTIFRTVDGFRAGADNRHTRFFQSARELQWRLTTVLHDHTLGLLDTDDFQYIFQGNRLEIQAIRGIVIG